MFRFIFFSLSCFLTPLFTSAQLSVGSESFPNSNSSLGYQEGSLSWFSTQGLTEISGENQTWEMEDWDFTEISGETYEPLSEASTAYQIFFDNEFFYPEHFSNLFLPVQTLDIELPVNVEDPAIFYRNDESGYYNTGNAFSFEGIPIITQNAEIERLFEFPLEFGDVDSSSINFLTSVPFFGAYGQFGDRVNTVDGSGELITPLGTYEVLRIKAERSLVDTFYIEQNETGQTIPRPLETTYYWVSPDIRGPILVIGQSAGLTTGARFLADLALSTNTSISETLTVYPNPAKGFVNVRGLAAGPFEYDLYDAFGRLRQSGITSNQKIDVSDLESGIYLLKFSEGDKQHSSRLVITE